MFKASNIFELKVEQRKVKRSSSIYCYKKNNSQITAMRLKYVKVDWNYFLCHSLAGDSEIAVIRGFDWWSFNWKSETKQKMDGQNDNKMWKDIAIRLICWWWRNNNLAYNCQIYSYVDMKERALFSTAAATAAATTTTKIPLDKLFHFYDHMKWVA